MGYEKERALQQDEQGWSYSPDTDICARCVSNDELAAYIRENASGFMCSFCDRTSKRNPSTIPLDELMEIVGKVVHQYYEEAVGALGWEDGQYIGKTYDAYDIIGDFDITEQDDARNAIIQALNSGPRATNTPTPPPDSRRISSVGNSSVQRSSTARATSLTDATRGSDTRPTSPLPHTCSTRLVACSASTA